jgi:hypothetical protein
MTHDTSPECDLATLEMTVSKDGKGITEFPAGALAKAWLDEYSRQLTWADLRRWLRESPPPAL